jgi:hypothetical protein
LLGVLVIMIVLMAYVRVHDEKQEYRWPGKKEIPRIGMSVARGPPSGIPGILLPPL